MIKYVVKSLLIVHFDGNRKVTDERFLDLVQTYLYDVGLTFDRTTEFGNLYSGEIKTRLQLNCSTSIS